MKEMLEDSPRTADRTLFHLGTAAAVLALAVITFHNTASIYAGNVEEFGFGLVDYLLPLAAVFAAGSVLLLAPLFIVHGSARKVYVALLCFLGLVAWIYGSVLLFDLGVLDGAELRFDIARRYRPYELVGLWLLLGGLGVTVHRWPKALLAFMIILNVGLIFPSTATLLQDRRNIKPGGEEVDLKALFRFSPQKNSLIVLMDAFQADLFAKIVEEDSSLKSQFEGFSFFPDNLGVARTTYLTMPAIHAGKPYVPGLSLHQLYEKDISSGSFLNDLAEAGHHVTLIHPINNVCPDKIDICVGENEILYDRWDNLLSDTIYLLDLSLFRSVPLLLKKRFYNRGKWTFSRVIEKHRNIVIAGNRLLDVLTAELRVESGQPVTKFIHIFNTHMPWVVNSECEYERIQWRERRLGAIAQARCAVMTLVRLLEQLKAKGIYDETLVLLIADTGHGIPNSYTNGAGPAGWTDIVGAANPILLVKPMHARGALQVSTNSTQVTDVAATVCEQLQDCSRSYGLSAFEQSTNGRVRAFNYYFWKHAFWTYDELPNVAHYEVQGPLWNLNSWTRKWGTYRLGEEIDFTTSGNSDQYKGYGWTRSWESGSWSYGEVSNIGFMIDGDIEPDLVLRAQVSAMLDEKMRQKQVVDVLVNGQPLDQWEFQLGEGFSERHVVIPKDLARKDPVMQIAFHVHNPIAPASLFENWPDLRRYGVQVRSMTLNAAQVD